MAIALLAGSLVLVEIIFNSNEGNRKIDVVGKSTLELRFLFVFSQE